MDSSIKNICSFILHSFMHLKDRKRQERDLIKEINPLKTAFQTVVIMDLGCQTAKMKKHTPQNEISVKVKQVILWIFFRVSMKTYEFMDERR